MISLNLLPAEQKHDVALSREEARWQPAIMIVAIVSIVMVIAVYFGQAVLSLRLQTLDSQLQSLQTAGQQKLTDVIDQTTKLNADISLVDAKLGTVRSWSKDMAAILQLLPPDIAVTSLVVDTQGQVRLEGVAATRLSFLSLQTALTSSSILKNVSTTSTASKRDNVPFIYSAQLK